jgi:hypothetical protein
MAIQSEAEGNYRPLERAFPRARPLLWGESHPRVNLGNPTISVESGLSVGADGVRLRAFAPWEERNGVDQLRSFDLGSTRGGLREESRQTIFVAHVVALANNARLGLVHAGLLPVLDPDYLEETSHVDFLLLTSSFLDDAYVLSDLTLVPASLTVVLGSQLSPLGLGGLERGRIAANLLLGQLFDDHAKGKSFGVLLPVGALLLRAIHWHCRNVVRDEGRVAFIERAALKIGEVVHATVAIVKRGDDITRAPRNARLKVPKVGVTREHVRQNFLGLNIFNHTPHDIGPLGALWGGLAEVSGARIKPTPLVQSKGLANLSSAEDSLPAHTHLPTLLPRGSIPSVSVAPGGALRGLLSNGPTPVFFFEIRKGLSVETNKFGFPEPCVRELPMVGGRIARPDIFDVVSAQHVEPGNGFTRAIEKTNIDRGGSTASVGMNMLVRGCTCTRMT